MIRLVTWLGAGVAAAVWSLFSLAVFVLVSLIEGVFEGGAAIVSAPFGGMDFGIGWLSDLLGDIGQVVVIMLWLAGLAGIWFAKRLLLSRARRTGDVRPAPAVVHNAQWPPGPARSEVSRVATVPAVMGQTLLVQKLSEKRRQPETNGALLKKIASIAKGKPGLN